MIGFLNTLFCRREKYFWASASELSITRVLGPESGDFPAIHLPEAPRFATFCRSKEQRSDPYVSRAERLTKEGELCVAGCTEVDEPDASTDKHYRQDEGFNDDHAKCCRRGAYQLGHGRS